MQDGLRLIRYIDHEKMIGLVLECRGTRSYGSAAIEIAYVASGRLDAYISMRLVAVGYCGWNGYCQ